MEMKKGKYFLIYLFHNYHQCIPLHTHKCNNLHHLCSFLHFYMDYFHSHRYLYMQILTMNIYLDVLFSNQASIFFNGIERDRNLTFSTNFINFF